MTYEEAFKYEEAFNEANMYCFCCECKVDDNAKNLILDALEKQIECPLFEKDKSEFVKQKTAHWSMKETSTPILIDEYECVGYYTDFTCSNCGHTYTTEDDEEYFIEEHKYCPWCGAKMREGDRNDL